MATQGAARIDGNAIAKKIHEELTSEAQLLLKDFGVQPKLAVVLVGERKDSQTYVRMKQQAAEKDGFGFILKETPAAISQDELLQLVTELNTADDIHGVIVQLPLPEHINEKVILDAVSYEKDIDGFHPLNIGALAMKGRDPLFIPCTPKACLELLDRSGVALDGKNVVVLGRSNIVGIPVAMLCLHRNATVTICHSRTVDLPSKCREADILVAAVGRPEMVKKDWVKPGAVVIDVGINSIPDVSRKTGSRLVGDVAFDEVQQVAGMITPVPGGVGPMTVAMLLRNTLNAAKRRASGAAATQH
eukprot:TRINITY_DN1073_c0_g1_i1.p1 TRINITY_DN1073_c0_g1~~TRINITY_DN1073_c0_g1_i1.p1  ORF type:complete len:303 (-),score=77.35 TRINITY_DN1073_c0_g1_i1:338-1246(-)